MTPQPALTDLYSLPLATVTVASRGRHATKATVTQLGVLLSSGTIDTGGLAGSPIMPLISFAQGKGIDPSQALADGINQHLRKVAPSVTPLSKVLLDRGVVSSVKDARLGDMHLKKLAKILHMKPERLLEVAEDAMTAPQAPAEAD